MSELTNFRIKKVRERSLSIIKGFSDSSKSSMFEKANDDNLEKGQSDELEKAGGKKDVSKLQKKEIVNKAGKKQSVWVANKVDDVLNHAINEDHSDWRNSIKNKHKELKKKLGSGLKVNEHYRSALKKIIKDSPEVFNIKNESDEKKYINSVLQKIAKHATN